MQHEEALEVHWRWLASLGEQAEHVGRIGTVQSACMGEYMRTDEAQACVLELVRANWSCQAWDALLRRGAPTEEMPLAAKRYLWCLWVRCAFLTNRVLGVHTNCAEVVSDVLRMPQRILEKPVENVPPEVFAPCVCRAAAARMLDYLVGLYSEQDTGWLRPKVLDLWDRARGCLPLPEHTRLLTIVCFMLVVKFYNVKSPLLVDLARFSGESVDAIRDAEVQALEALDFRILVDIADLGSQP